MSLKEFIGRWKIFHNFEHQTDCGMKIPLIRKKEKPKYFQYLAVLLIIISASAIFYLFKDYIGYRIVSFFLLFVVSILAVFFETGPILLASTLSAIIWDFFFIPPSFTLHIGDTEDTLLLVMFFIVALLNGILTSRIKRQELNARQREERSQALYQLTRELLSTTGISEIIKVAEEYFNMYFHIRPHLILKKPDGSLDFSLLRSSDHEIDEATKRIAEWVFNNTSKAGRFTDHFNSSPLTFYPFRSGQNNLGVVCLDFHEALNQSEEQFLETFFALIAGKIENEYLAIKANDAFVLSASDKLYKTLFSSISHELRIPVATILGATDALQSDKYNVSTRKRLYSEMGTAAIRLNRLIENLLNMSRLESGHLKPNPDWCDVHDIINKLTETLKNELAPYHFIEEIPEDMPLVFIDFGLMEQVLHNLVLNAIQNAPQGSEIKASFLYDGTGRLIIEVADCGKGLEETEMSLLFNKFYRGKDATSGGTGLGLSIVKGFVEALGGTVSARNNKPRGAVFIVEVPVSVSDISEYR